MTRNAHVKSDIRHHRWSESGQLAATIDNEHCAFYTYDGNGNRAYKLTGNTMLDQYNAGQQFFHAYLNDAVVYVNPYFTISRKNYTRHIFNGTQRIATEIGTSDLSDCIDTTAAGMERLAYARAYMQSLFAEPIELHSDTGTTFVDIDGEAYDELQWQCFGGDRLWQITIACDSDILLPILRRDSGAADTRVSGRYFYHTDHLGSANWVTNGDEAVQFIHYMPYGEMWYNQRGSAYNERYKYTGKERDEETGNDYFGARYYAAYTPMWLSPDPLMDKYPGISPYAYCNWNPMKYVDLDGNSYSDFDEEGNYIGTSHDNWFHNTFVGQKGRVIGSNGDVKKTFKFADPHNDVANLKSGTITKLQFVNESDIAEMLQSAGAFDISNNTHSTTIWNRYKYILNEGTGKLDFACKHKDGMIDKYGVDTYTSLYLIGSYAHNTKNFGNFLFGAAGVSLGYFPIELLFGAHWNSLFAPETNGYKPQFDSRDDQFSIFLGILHAYFNQYPNSK